MFERFTESARRALFFARYEVTQLGGVTIEPEHLVLGVLRDSPQAVARFSRGGESAIRQALVDALGERGETVPTSVEIPFSRACKSALEQTRIEADAAKNRWIHAEHIVLGVLAATDGAAARVLRDAGVTAAAIRDHLAIAPAESQGAPSPAQHAPMPGMISRQWKGVVRPGKADEYLAHLRRETLPALQRIDGFVTAAVLKREVEDGTEFEIATIWRSAAAIEAFAGADVTLAVVPPAARALLARYEERTVHYEIVQ